MGTAERNVFVGLGLDINLNASSDNGIAGNCFGLVADGRSGSSSR